MTLTVELPEDVATVLRRIPTQERNEYAVAVIRQAIQSGTIAPSKNPPTTDADRIDFEESCLAISRSVTQIETGESFSLEECTARASERHAQRLAAREKALTENSVS